MEQVKIYPTKEKNSLFAIKDSGFDVPITIEEYDQIEKQGVATLDIDNDILILKKPDTFWDGILDGFQGVDYSYLDD